MVILGRNYYKLTVSVDVTVIFSKFACSCALHLMLYPKFNKSMSLLKHINNHTYLYNNPTAAQLIAACQTVIIFGAELTNLYMLAYQHESEHVIMHFVTLEVIVELPELYMNSLVEDAQKDIIMK